VTDRCPPVWGRTVKGPQPQFALAPPFGLACTHSDVWQYRPAVVLSGRLTNGARSRTLSRPQLLRAAASTPVRHPSRHGRDAYARRLRSLGASWRSRPLSQSPRRSRNVCGGKQDASASPSNRRQDEWSRAQDKAGNQPRSANGDTVHSTNSGSCLHLSQQLAPRSHLRAIPAPRRMQAGATRRWLSLRAIERIAARAGRPGRTRCPGCLRPAVSRSVR
jgi:hypothetical protein